MVEDRCRLAEQAGAAFCAAPTDEGMAAVENALAEVTGGRGADQVFLAAGGTSNGPVEAAARLARDRATVVDIGKCRLDLPWNAYYDKELDVRFSRSYGPGRYDDRYELEGIDYPAGYVRWTERRNLECFLDLIARKEIDVEPLVSGIFPIEQATAVYGDLASGACPRWACCSSTPRPRRRPSRARSAGWSRAAGGRAARHGRPAAGGRVHRCRQLRLVDAAATPRQDGRPSSWPTSRPTGRCRRSTRSAVSGSRPPRPTPKRCSATVAGCDLHRDPPHTHADLVCRALETGKAVFVEKPLALTEDELERVIDASRRPATTGSWSASTGGSPRC